MRILNTLLICLLLAVFSLSVSGETSYTPLEKAMAVYKIKGVDNFIPALLQGSPLSGDASILAKVATIKRIESYYGSLLDYEVVEECILSSKVTLIYYVIQYDRGPLFGTVTVYNSHGKQVVTRFNFQTDVTKLWNANLPCRP